MRVEEIVEVCGVGDLEHLDEDASHQFSGLLAGRQQPGEDMAGLLPSDGLQDPAFSGTEQDSAPRIKLGQGYLDPVGATDEDDSRKVG